MKRDMDLARKILFEVEKQPFTHGKIEGYSSEEISYHVLLLAEAGLIEADISSVSDAIYKPKRLTWNGHEFLDAARDNNRWEKAKKATALAGGFAFDIKKQLLIQYLKTELKLP